MKSVITESTPNSKILSSAKIQRDNSIDIARGFAILLMIQGHLSILVPYSGNLNNFLSLLSPATFFLVVAGMSYEFFITSRLIRYNHSKLVFFETIYRALILISVDLLMLLVGSFVSPSIYHFTLEWGVIEVIAFGYIMGCFFQKDIKSKISLTVCLIFLMVLLKFNSLNNLILFNISMTLLPKLIYFQFGRLIPDLFRSIKSKNHLLVISILALCCNISIIYIYTLVYHVNISLNGITEHRWEFPTILFLIVNIFLLMILIRRLCNSPNMKFLLEPIERLGKIAFTVYFVHIGILLAISIFIRKFLPTFNIPPLFTLQIFVLISFVILFSKFEKYWKSYGYIFGFEWILRKGSIFLLKLTQKSSISKISEENVPIL
jgi:uncharacterized membrane protein YeiB